MGDFLAGLISKIKLDFNRDGQDDVKQLKEALDALLKSLQEAIEKLDYKTVIVHLKSIMEALQAITFYLQEIQKTVNTPQVQQAINDLKLTINSLGKLINTFVEKK